MGDYERGIDALRQRLKGPEPSLTKPAQVAEEPLPENIEDVRAKIRRLETRRDVGGYPWTSEEQAFYLKWKGK